MTSELSHRLSSPKYNATTAWVSIYIDVVTWERLAETCGQYLTQGRQVAVSGRLDYREWADAKGARRSRHEIVAAGVDFLAQPKTREGEAG